MLCVNDGKDAVCTLLASVIDVMDYLGNWSVKYSCSCCRCFMIDHSGYIVMHPDFIGASGLETMLVENVHITVKVRANFHLQTGIIGAVSSYFIYIYKRKIAM